ncbi:hypothetical protein [Hyalangium versicolor]|uniref:hypothetical protein n=1 Tax=Hyalangium versicolor TaxID=2861190 RepID=UPI001CCC20A1|nr:hypothetical protein [Hyalangium versicolor]
MKTPLRLFAALTALCAVACGGTAVQTQDLEGTWSSASCEAVPNGDGTNSYLQRTFTLTEDTWTLKVDAFGDAQCQTKLFSARVGGPYELEKDSEKVEGATEATFTFKDQYMTAYVQGLADTFQSTHCGSGTWKVGEEQSTASTGCLFFRPTSACSSDHDIVKVDGDKLFFGQRPADNDMCTADKRPTALTTAAVVKR